MTKAVLILGDINNIKVQNEIKNHISVENSKERTFKEIIKQNNVCYLNNEIEKLTIQDIESYQEFFMHTNFLGGQKIGIISDFTLISTIQQNKLLKTIEDELKESIHILVGQNTSKVLPTILSRVYTIDLSQEQLTYPSKHSFYQDIIHKSSELNYLKANEKIAEKIIKIYELYLDRKYDEAFITFCKEDFKKIDNQAATIVFRIIITILTKQKQYKLVKEIIKKEQRIYANVNVNLQIEAIMVQIMNTLKNL